MAEVLSENHQLCRIIAASIKRRLATRQQHEPEFVHCRPLESPLRIVRIFAVRISIVRISAIEFLSYRILQRPILRGPMAANAPTHFPEDPLKGGDGAALREIEQEDLGFCLAGNGD